ncbi:unnamed protein product [Gongylonema pulchrum]|uniref:Pyrroline-5-carboxylate reductase n=1 Tax=Gongylonema pulchrum TaxID=637853 RepID=A0A183ECK0_9BILA|nr:unnamed protein product [Gongylonema pulchrum]
MMTVREQHRMGLFTKNDIAVSVRTVGSAQRWKVSKLLMIVKLVSQFFFSKVEKRSKQCAEEMHLQALGYSNIYTSNVALLQEHGQGLVILSVKPHMRSAVFQEVDGRIWAGIPLIVSLMSGVDLATLEEEASQKYYEHGIIRLMPNIPVGVCTGATVMCASSSMPAAKIALVKFIMEHVGTCVMMSEQAFNAATAVVGCGPAFASFFLYHPLP